LFCFHGQRNLFLRIHLPALFIELSLMHLPDR
jgi:hypothetical protein